MRDEEAFAGDFAQVADRHQQDERAMGIGEPRPVDRRLGFGRVFVTRHDGERRIVRTVRDRYPRVGGRRNRGRNAGHDFERYSRGAQGLRFLGAAAEDERVPAFEAHDAFALARFKHGERFDLFLRHRVVAAALADEDAFALRRSHRYDGVARKRVVEQHAGVAQYVGGA